MGQILTGVVLITFAVIGAWVLFWGVIGYATAREPGWTPTLGAVTCILLGPIGYVLVLVLSRDGRGSKNGEEDGDGAGGTLPLDDLFGEPPF